MTKKDNPYDQRYATEGYYWGKKPSAMCDRVMELVRPRPGFRPRLLDLGCGEGRNAVYFAKHGFEVAGLDASPPGLEKTRRYAEEVGVRVTVIHADVLNYEPADTYDVSVEMTLFLDSVYDNVGVITGGAVVLPTVTLLGGDLDDSDTVTIDDVTAMVGLLGQASAAGDPDGDGTVTINDVTGLVAHFGQSSPVPWS